MDLQHGLASAMCEILQRLTGLKRSNLRVVRVAETGSLAARKRCMLTAAIESSNTTMTGKHMDEYTAGLMQGWRNRDLEIGSVAVPSRRGLG